MELLRRKDLGPCTESGQRMDGSFEKRSKKKAPCLLPDVYGQGKDKALFASRPSFGDACLRRRWGRFIRPGRGLPREHVQ